MQYARIILTALLALSFTSIAEAQAVHLSQYRAAETAEDGLAISRPDDLGHLRWSAQLHLDYGYNPLVYETALGDTSTELSLVEHQLVAQAGFAFGLFDRLVLFAGLPVNLVMEGDDVPGIAAPDGAGLGDLSLGARGRLLGERGDLFALALQLTATFPTAQAANEAMRFSGEDGVTLHPEVLAEIRPGAGVRLTANLGARVRSTDRARFNTLTVGHELTYGLGVSVPVVEDLVTAHVEAYGAFVFDDFGGRQTSPFEAIAGVTVHPIPGMRVGLAAGPGIARGYGTPDFRGVLTVGYAEPAPAPATAEPEPAPSDRDGDGIPDDDDQCADEPEDQDGFQDDDGCPDPDNDADGVPDTDDACPNDAEDQDGHEDADGCPDLDNDGDNIPDTSDRCPNEPGPADEQGCPRVYRDVEVTSTGIVIHQTVYFEFNRAVIRPQSFPLLDTVAQVMRDFPDITVEVQGHTDDRGRDEYNLRLSGERAEAVRQYLIQAGIAAERMTSRGYGESRPIDSNRTAAGRARNRRVEFVRTDPAAQQSRQDDAVP